MDQKTDRIFSLASLENKIDDLERRIKKRMIDDSSLNNSITNIKEIITYFKDENIKSKKKYKYL